MVASSYWEQIAWLEAQPDVLGGMPHVGKDQVDTPEGPATVSTIFLGFDLSAHGAADPEFVETMITPAFAAEASFLRYPTWDAAETCHRLLVGVIAAGKFPWIREKEAEC